MYLTFNVKGAGNVQIAVSTVDLRSPEQMPGDYTVRQPGGATRVMQSYGAGIVEITSGAAPKVITSTITNDPPQRHVIYNLPTNVNIVLAPIRLSDVTSIGTFVVNIGRPQNQTNPNLPVLTSQGYTACAARVTPDDQAVPPAPAPGLNQFLHGLYSFEGINWINAGAPPP